MNDDREWEFWIDVGGTFTDCIARHPDGRLLRHKLLSSGVTKGAVGSGSSQNAIVDPARCKDPPDFWTGYRLRIYDINNTVAGQSLICVFEAATGTLRLEPALPTPPPIGAVYELTAGEEAPVTAIRYLTGRALDDRLPDASVRLGTTRGTNALLTRQGATTALVTTQGFGDVLRIGYQNRPRLFDLSIHKPTPLYERVVEIDERMTHEGQPLRLPDESKVKAQLQRLRDRGIRALAICFLHAYRHPRHERQVAAWARELGFEEISLSSEAAPLIGIVSRGNTTVVDAYLNPVLRGYLSGIREHLAEGPLRLMTSSGGLIAAAAFRGKDSILSGPAGGVVGCARVATAAGFPRAIGFDMGGTSTDVSRYDGCFEMQYESEKAGVPIVTPMMAIHTVAAGGGSLCGFDGIKLVVGPASAGAEPGPACYGRGGPLTVTDLNVLLGKLLPQRFPFPLDRDAASTRAEAMATEIAAKAGRRYSEVELCDGFLRIANANMAEAIRAISVAQGANPQEYTLVAFGGAAGQHACAVARELSVHRILIHPDAGILSAYGIGHADVVRHAVEAVYAIYDHSAPQQLEKVFDRLITAARHEVASEGINPDNIFVRRCLDLRYHGLDTTLTVEQPPDLDFSAAYHAVHKKRYGYDRPDEPIEIVAARVEASGRSGQSEQRSSAVPHTEPSPQLQTVAYFDARHCDVNVFQREDLQPGDHFHGPAIVCEANCTTVVDPGWSAEVYSGGELVLSDRDGSTTQLSSNSTSADPIMLEIFNNRFTAIANQMGITLRNTSSSVNVKQRLDFSCAIFTPTGNLVANAPHVPVHLGAMGATVRCILADHRTMRPGDVFVTNDPYRGGSHLPDVTVVTPVHGESNGDETEGRLIFITASRAHHAEIGGIRPGSMPPFSTNLAEEGVLIPPFKLFDAGQPRFEDLRKLLLSAAYPTRAVEDNLADIAAQDAANRQGARDLATLVDHYGLAVVQAYMRHIQTAAASKMRGAIAKLPDGRHEFIDYLDVADGYEPIRVAIEIQGEEATIDFNGTADVLSGNLNGNGAIVTAAVMYCLRCLIREDIPLNEGVLEPVRIVVPECLLNPPRYDSPEQCAAVSAGNVETSQRIVDAVFGALGVAAASQGTMNNLLFGNETFGYYETICGGSGATADADGADAVHTHMTNTRLTDVEILEQRYPVRVLEFAVRLGSGGDGRHRGGNGVVRKIEFLQQLDVSILSQRRGEHPPYGLLGGTPGRTGQNTLIHADGSTSKLGGQVEFVAQGGDVLVIETPGGGGYGT